MQATSPPKILLDEREAANSYGLTPRCFQAWRARGGGPPFVKVSSRCIRYRVSDLEEWAQNRLRMSTADQGAE